MRAFHVMWSRPSIESKHRCGVEFRFSPNSPIQECFEFHDYDILLTMVSILKWKQLNGTIKLYADSLLVSRYSDLGILDLWDNYNTDILDNIDSKSINPTMFWSSGKFFAYLNEQSPCVYIDTDVIAWQNLEKFYPNIDLRFTHWESIKKPWYCSRKCLKKPFNYRFKRIWNWNQTMAVNTAILYFGNQYLKNYYAQEAIRYITNNSIDINFAKYATPEILFVEQRLLSMCTREMGVKVLPFLDAVWNPQQGWFTKDDKDYGKWLSFKVTNQPLFTHTWVYKHYLEKNMNVRHSYCLDLIKVIRTEFPHHLHLLENIECTRKYFELSSTS